MDTHTIILIPTIRIIPLIIHILTMVTGTAVTRIIGGGVARRGGGRLYPSVSAGAGEVLILTETGTGMGMVTGIMAAIHIHPVARTQSA